MKIHRSKHPNFIRNILINKGTLFTEYFIASTVGILSFDHKLITLYKDTNIYNNLLHKYTHNVMNIS